MGFQGSVRSVLTKVQVVNPDPRPESRRKLSFELAPDWAVFDSQGKRIEFASPSGRGGIGVISKCTFKSDGKVCTESTGQQHEERQEEITLADGRRQRTYYRDSHIEHRSVSRLNEHGIPASSIHYHSEGRIASENTRQSTGEGESTTWKLYDGNGHVLLNWRTLEADDESRIDRWAYGPEGRLVWHLAISAEGEVLSSWYELGYKPTHSGFDSLSTCGPRLCVSYKFDEQGSGRLEKTVQHLLREDYFELGSEEHFDFDGRLDEKVQINYERDGHGNWTSRTVSVWNPVPNQTIEVQRDSRTIQYY